MDVNEIFEQGYIKSSVLSCQSIDVSGWLVIIDWALCVIAEGYAEPFEESDKIRLSNREIVFSVCDSILPLGGGKSFVFHRVKMVGNFDARSGLFDVESMLLEDDPGKYISIDISAPFIEQAKQKYPSLLERSEIDSRDWIDYYL